MEVWDAKPSLAEVLPSAQTWSTGTERASFPVLSQSSRARRATARRTSRARLRRLRAILAVKVHLLGLNRLLATRRKRHVTSYTQELGTGRLAQSFDALRSFAVDAHVHLGPH